MIRSRTDTILDYDDPIDDRNGQLSPKPMTPRRVKRRSVMTRGSNSRHSTTSRRSHTSTNNRSSTRSSRRKIPQNPVTKIMEQQQIKPFASFQHNDNPTLTASNLQSLNNEIIAKSQPKTAVAYSNFKQNISPDPIYYNMSGSTTQLQQSWNSASASQTGHFNPTYQHSTPNLNADEHVDEVYNNRPPSVRSSYSNFHGARRLSSYNPTTENVFAGITGGGPQNSQQIHHQHPHQQQLQTQQQLHQHHHPQQPQQLQQPHQQLHTPPPPLLPHQPPPPSLHHQQNYPPNPPSQPQNIPISKRTASRESIRSMAFLNSGPPAYNLNYHTPPDSETTM